MYNTLAQVHDALETWQLQCKKKLNLIEIAWYNGIGELLYEIDKENLPAGKAGN